MHSGLEQLGEGTAGADVWGHLGGWSRERPGEHGLGGSSGESL